MQSIYELVTLEVQNEHDLEHDLAHKKLFSTPKIYDAKGDLGKRWYVYFSYLNPETEKLERMKNIYGKTNRYKTKEARYSILSVYKKRLSKLLKEGYNPLLDNTKHHEAQLSNSKESSIVKNTLKEDVSSVLNLEEAIGMALKLKTNVVSSRTYVDYENRCKIFVKWLKENKVDITNVKYIRKKPCLEFLNAVQLKTSARNRNNYKTGLSSVFQTMEDNEIIEKNYFKSINN